MRQYDDLVEVRKGPVPGFGADGPELWSDPFSDVLTLDPERRAEQAGVADVPAVGPQQFLWQGRLWQVREVISHWMEVGAWWLRRPEEQPGGSRLVHEREVWRVTAARGRAVATAGDPGFGVFDLAFDPAGGVWRLAAALD